MTTVLSLFGMREVTGYNSRHGADDSMPLPNQLVGLELEIEGWNPEYDKRFGGFNFTDDGSLRNNGTEAVSRPVATKHVRNLLTAFYAHFKTSEANYSERCSTHVHFNVQPLTLEQLSSVALLYQTAEQLLFNWVGNDRDQNIFCVPWQQCSLNYNVVEKIASNADGVFRRWQKYAALNLIPVSEHGTIEFRHLHGTCDVERICTWVAILSKMFEFALKHPLEAVRESILQMNTVSNYRGWMMEVFGKYADALSTPGFEESLALGVIGAKVMLAKETRPQYEDNAFERLLERDRQRARDQQLIRESLAGLAELNVERAEERIVATAATADRTRRPMPVPQGFTGMVHWGDGPIVGGTR